MSSALRTVAFVDGQNSSKNLQKFAFSTSHFDREFRLDERHFRWRGFFSDMAAWFAEKTGVGHRLVRAYWYNAASITPFEKSERVVANALSECQKTAPDLTVEQLRRLAEDWHTQERRRFDVDRRRVLEDIQRRTEFLEFRFVGQYRVEPFTVHQFGLNPDGSCFYMGKRVGEKGVDVGIAVDMIAKMPNYDVAVIVSGDADFIPAIAHVKDHLRSVYQFSVAKGVPPRISYLSPWLKGTVDVFGYFDEARLLGKYLDPAAVPPAIAEEISRRVEELQAALPDPRRP
jgi:uncharacterized LabA/DUF88 family protein